jgi:DNA-directed RNA polymerase subunit P
MACVPELPGLVGPSLLDGRMEVPSLRPHLRRRGVSADRDDLVPPRNRRDRESRGTGEAGDAEVEGELVVYKCAKCQEPIRANINTVGIQCERCGSKIFYKERPNVKKVVQAR